MTKRSCPVLEAMQIHCEETGIDLTTVGKLLTDKLREDIAEEATKLNLLIKE